MDFAGIIKQRVFVDCCKNCLHCKPSNLKEGCYRCTSLRKGGENGVNGLLSEKQVNFCVCDVFIHKNAEMRRTKAKKLEDEIKLLEEMNL